jgi:cysteine synthase
MFEHVSDALELPALVQVQPGLVCLRFEVMKILSASAAVRRLFESGTVSRGDTLIDSSSGIYAYALALACHRFGMRCYIVGSTTIDRALKVQLEILGATLEQVRPSDSLALDQSLRVARIRQILAQNPSFYWMQQYHDPIHCLGYARAAALVDRRVPAGPITLTGGVGSGASTAGLATHLRALGRRVTVVGVQPFGSLTFGSDTIEDRQIIIAGIGSSIEFRNVRHELYDRIHWVGFAPAAAGAIGLLRQSAIFAGLSSGAAFLAARWEQLCNDSSVHLFIAADTGHRYVEPVFSRHAEFRDVGFWAPAEIAALSELESPWSAMAWGGRAAPRCAAPAAGDAHDAAVRGAPEEMLDR